MNPTFTPLDCGGGRRLDDAGGILLDRPSPAALGKQSPQAPWKKAHFYYTGPSMNCGRWEQRRECPSVLQATCSFADKRPLSLPPIEIEGLLVELRLSPSGQVGIFPEQRTNWRLLASPQLPRGLKLLNLFAYTGLSTLASLHGGHSVTHVDAARSVVRWAKKNAELSGMADFPARWIAEDAMRFCKREARRGSSYDGFILDPPAFGRGPKGESWKIERDLPELLGFLQKLCLGEPRLILLSAHQPTWDANTLKALLADAFPNLAQRGRMQAYPLVETFASGASLSVGFCVSYQGRV